MERYPERLFVRIAPEDKTGAQEVADALGISLSDLVRSLVRLAAEGLARGGGEAGAPRRKTTRDRGPERTRDERRGQR